jgi:hypothetical protein
MSRTFKVGKVEARFENESWETRSSWGIRHAFTLMTIL